LALTSPASGGGWVGIARLRAKSDGVYFCALKSNVSYFGKFATISNSIVVDTQISEVGATPEKFNFGPEIMYGAKSSKVHLYSVIYGNLLWLESTDKLLDPLHLKQTNSVAFSPQANYTN
jgi:hypothetical protein